MDNAVQIMGEGFWNQNLNVVRAFRPCFLQLKKNHKNHYYWVSL
jgi:hypothetical protein